MIPRWMNVVRAMSSEGWGRIAYHTTIRGLLDTDPSVRGFMEGRGRPAAGLLRGADPAGPGPPAPAPAAGALMHDPNAYLKSVGDAQVTPLRGTRRGRGAAAAVPLNSPLPN